MSAEYENRLPAIRTQSAAYGDVYDSHAKRKAWDDLHEAVLMALHDGLTDQQILTALQEGISEFEADKMVEIDP